MTNIIDRRASRRSGVVLIAALGASVLVSLDLFIVNLALPRVAEAFPLASAPVVSWVLNGYTVAFAALLAPAGRVADRYGRRTVFRAGMVLFAAGSVLTTLAPDISWLILGRVLQGAGASVVVPTSLALLLEAFPEGAHKRMVSLWTATGSVAAAVGPVLGGMLADLDWRLVFAIMVPLSVLTLLATFALPPSPVTGGRAPDWAGALALVAAVAALIILLTYWADWTPADSRTWLAACLAVLSFGVFIKRSRRHASPVIDLSLFRVLPFASATVGMAAFYTGFSMMLLGCSLWATNVWHWDSATTGIAFILGPGLAVVSALAAGRRSTGPAVLSAIGGALFVVAGVVWALTLTGPKASAAGFLIGFALTGVAAGIAQTGFLSGGAGALPAGDYAAGTGMINTARQIGAALGVALLTLCVGSGYDPGTYRPVWIIIIAAGAVSAITILPAWLRVGHSPKSVRCPQLR
ncbi:MAG TPA: MFS transporter [Flexivirga sp.]|uniref:MFS transporter n=1 Tax=Flexivirga sp. TaxID=1962927 RepID=UPI002B772417|nr:MFS transporter [Flexivirga sp.]HWC21811.1 MFS transporter [Flexivirga sp.]